MAEDKQVKKYFENLPYGKDSKSSEIHGVENTRIINEFVANLVLEYDKAIEAKDKKTASIYNKAIKQIAQDLDNLKDIKQEFAMNYGGGIGGKNLFSNYTDLNWDRAFMIEQGKIAFDADMRLVLSVPNSEGGFDYKRIEDITENWVIKGDEENRYMEMQQDAQKQSNTIGQPLDFDIDWAVSKLLDNGDAWKVMATDKIGGRYFLHDYLQENKDKIASGEITDEMLHPDSFDPDFDNRLHEHYAGILKKSFDPNYQTVREAQEAFRNMFPVQSLRALERQKRLRKFRRRKHKNTPE